MEQCKQQQCHILRVHTYVVSPCTSAYQTINYVPVKLFTIQLSLTYTTVSNLHVYTKCMRKIYRKAICKENPTDYGTFKIFF